MSKSNRSILGLILGGVTYLVIHLSIEVAFPDHWTGSPTRLLGLSYAGWSRLLWIPTGLLLLGLGGIYRHLSHGLGKLGTLGYRIAAAGFGLDILGGVIEFWVYGTLLVPLVGEFTTGSPGSQLGYSIASLGSLLGILGLLVFGIAGLRAPLPTRWRVLPLMVGLVSLSIFYFFFTELLAVHAVLYGLSWIVLAYLLWKDKAVAEK